MPSSWKVAFALVAVAIMLLAIASQVHQESLQTHTKVEPDPHRRTIDLDFAVADPGQEDVGHFAVGPFGQIDLGRRADAMIARYRLGTDWVSFSAAGTTFSTLESWKGSVGSSVPAVDGVRARYPYFYPSTGLEVVSGIDGMEMVLDVRAPLFIARGDLSYSFFVDMSPALYPAVSDRPLWLEGPGPHVIAGAIPLKDSSGRTALVITPAMALIEYREAAGPVVNRVNDLEFTSYFPAHPEGDRVVIPLDYAVEFDGTRMKLSVLVPTELSTDPAIVWPIRIDPGITNPIAGSSYFADETIIMDSDLVVTATGAAQFSNVSLIMNRTAAPNYNISVAPGGRITLLGSRVRPNDTALPFGFWVNGSLVGQDTTINETRDGLNVTGGNLTISNVTIHRSAGPGLALVSTNASMANSTINGSVGAGVWAKRSTIESAGLSVNGSGSDGIYLNATGGNLTWARVNASALSGIKIVNGSRMNVSYGWVNASGRNGILVIGGAPSIEGSEISNSTWTGVVLLDDHSAYLANSTIHHNNASGVQAGLNSSADIYLNSIHSNTNYGVFANRSNPNVEHNEIWNNSIGAYLEGAHKDGQPTPASSIEEDYPGSRGGSADGGASDPPADAGDIDTIGAPVRIPLDAGPIDITVVGPNETTKQPGESAAYTLDIRNNQGLQDVVSVTIDDDQSSWATVVPTSSVIPAASSVPGTLTLNVPSGASLCTVYNVRVWANGTNPPPNQDSIWTTTYVKGNTAVTVTNLNAADGDSVTLTARLTYAGSGVSGKNLAFTLNGLSLGTSQTDSSGYATKQATAYYPGVSQTILASFATDSCYVGASGTGTLTLTTVNTTLSVSATTGHYSDLDVLTARLTTSAGAKPVPAHIVHFSLDGTYLGVGVTDVQGYARFTFKNLRDTGTVNWNASFDASSPFVASSASSTFQTLIEPTTVFASDFSVKYGRVGTYEAWVKDDEGVPLSGVTAVFKRGGVQMGTGVTNSAGYAFYTDSSIATLSTSQNPFSIDSSYAGDSHYASSNKATTLLISGYTTWLNVPASSGYFSDGIALKAQLVDEMGTNVSGKTLKFCVDGAWEGTCNGVWSGDAVTDSNGWATVTWVANTRTPSTYFVNVTFLGDSSNATSKNTSNVTVLPEIIVIYAPIEVRTLVGTILQITVQLKEDDGPVLPGAAVRVALEGGDYANGTTDGSGFWSFNFDTRGLLTKRYALATTFAGSTNNSSAQMLTRVLVEFDADLHGNNIHHNSGWGIYANNSGSKIVGDTIQSNSYNVDVRNGTLLLYNSTVGFSVLFDYRVMDGGSLFSTNTTFNRDKVEFAASGVILHVRWYFDASVLDPATRSPLAGVRVVLKDLSLSTVLDKLTRPDGVLGPEAVTEYTQDSSGKAIKTPHTLSLPDISGSGFVLHMDSSKNLTLYNGSDADHDGIVDALESFSDVSWFEGEGHFVEASQIYKEPFTSGNASALKLSADSRITNENSFYSTATGTWRLLLRVASDDGNGRFRVVVKDSGGSTLLDEDFPVAKGYLWYGTRTFVLTSATVLKINVTDTSSNPTASHVRLDRLGTYREKDASSVRTHWPGQASDPALPDGDFDFMTDGFEIRANTFWYEAEWEVSAGSSRLVERTNASGGRTLKHPAGDTTIATYDQTDLTTGGDYVAVVRLWNAAGAPTASVDVQYTCSPDVTPALSATRSYLIGENFTTIQFAFNYRTSACSTSFALKVIDTADTSPQSDQPKVELDKVGLARVDRDPVVKADLTFGPNPPAPDARFAPAISRGSGDAQGYLYYVASGGTALVKVPLTPVSEGNLPAVLGTVTIGTVTTEPVLVDIGSAHMILIGASGGPGQLYIINRDTMQQYAGSPLILGATPIPNSIAYKDGAFYFTTQNGFVHAYNLSATGVATNRWSIDRSSTLGGSHGGASVHGDQVYYPFDKGLAVYSIDPKDAPSPARWTLGGAGGFPDPCGAANKPSGDAFTCSGLPPPSAWGSGIGGVNGTPVFDMGHVYFVGEFKNSSTNGDRYVLYHYDEQGNLKWARDLNWTGTTPGNPYAVHLLIKDGLVIAAGKTIDAIDKISGARVWRHDFTAAIPNGWTRWAPVATDGMLLFPQDDYLNAFDINGSLAGDKDNGNNFAADLTTAPGASRAEDMLWRRALSGTDNGQPLFGDFDNDGYFDVIFLHGSKVLYLGEVLVQYRSYTPWQQWGLDANRKGEADYQWRYMATDPLEADFDHDGIVDAEEVVKFAGYTLVEAEDATYWNAWNNDEGAIGSGGTGKKNFNFFHQFGVTLTSGPQSTGGPALDNSSINLRFFADTTGTYRFSMGSGGGTTVDLVYQEGSTLQTRSSAQPWNGYGNTGTWQQRQRSVPQKDDPMNLGMAENTSWIFQNATYVRIGYDGASNVVFVPLTMTLDSNLVRSFRDPQTGTGLWLVVYVSFEFTVELTGGQSYVLDLGLDLNKVSNALRTSSSFPDTVTWIRIEDIDRLRVDRQGMDPYQADGDRDNVPDGEELRMGWFPLSGDPDGDGLDDFQEWNGVTVGGKTYRTNPGDRDTDHDGLRDRVELGLGQVDTSPATVNDTTKNWGSYMEAVAHYFHGDPHFVPAATPCTQNPDADRCIPNWDADTGTTTTDPLDPDTDDDGMPDGWKDGWIYDESGRTESLRSYQYSSFYQSGARPIRYNESSWYQGDLYDNFPQAWEGEDADLSGARDTSDWTFWPSAGNSDQSGSASTRLEFLRKGTGETDPSKKDTDADDVPDGYEAWFATREPLIINGANDRPTPDPVHADNATDNENSAVPSIKWSRLGSGGSIAVGAGTNLFAQQAKGDGGAALTGTASIRTVKLDLSVQGGLSLGGVTFSLWQDSSPCATSTSGGAPLAGAEATAVVKDGGKTSFTFRSVVKVDLGSPEQTKCLYLVLRSSGAAVNWNGVGGTSTSTWQKAYGDSGTWTAVSPTPTTAVAFEIYDELGASTGDGASILKEYVAGTNPKVADTDGFSGGQQTGTPDKLNDGAEIATGVVYRTNAAFGALEVNGYAPGSVIYYDVDPATSGTASWQYFVYSDTLTDPIEPFGGSQNRTALLFVLPDGGTIVYNATEEKVYVLYPGSDFTNALQRTVDLATQSYYGGKAIVFTRSLYGSDDLWKDSAVIRDVFLPLQDQHKQLFATSPFDWDTDDDGIGDGQEPNRLSDQEENGFAALDTLNNARDADSDGDGLTDGQEMLQICPSWNTLYSPGDTSPPAGCGTGHEVNPDGDSRWAMADRDSDDDGINDSKEVLWSSNSGGLERINLIDPDSDGDMLCDGWCTSATVSGVSVTKDRGEDLNRNGTNEQGEPSPVKVDTDGDGLWDGPDVGANKGELLVIPSTGASTTRTLGGDASAQSTFSNQTNPDSDGDGVNDGSEVKGYTAYYYSGTGAGTSSQRTNILMDPTKNDTDADGILDGKEFRRTDGSRVDTDGDTLNDGVEDANKDGIRQGTEIDPLRADTDQDGLDDKKEIGSDGVRQTGEPDALKADTDGDGVSDGNECFLTDTNCAGGTGLTRDSDSDGTPDVLEKDSDNDGLDDGVENWDRNGVIDTAKELDPTDPDTDCTCTDGTGLWDGAEPYPFTDTEDNPDTTINGRDTDSNNNGADDYSDTFVIFRTNAAGSAYGAAGAWVAVDVTVNVYTQSGEPDLSDTNARYNICTSSCATEVPSGAVVVMIYYGTGATSNPVPLKTPEGYAVYYKDEATDKIYIVKDETTMWQFEKASGETGYQSSNKPVQSYTAARQEAYEWRKALNPDSDFDGLTNGKEDLNGNGQTDTSGGLLLEPDPNNADTDGDGILDGAEPDWSANPDGDKIGTTSTAKINALDKDSDNDGLCDGWCLIGSTYYGEDANKDGVRQPTETDMQVPDTDGDLIHDGTERGITTTTDTADTCELWTDSGCATAWLLVPDGGAGTTNPLDMDTDDDGLCDGKCAIGGGNYLGEDMDLDGLKDTGESDATAFDTDGDGLSDGVEKGVVTPTKDTDLSKFAPDKDPSTFTDATKVDSENSGAGDGLEDGLEDKNKNGRVDAGETDPNDLDSDDDGLNDGIEDTNDNGIVDKEADGRLLETDPLAKDSDVDGLCDGWCAGQGEDQDLDGVLDTGESNPKVADTDGDGLRDGQETSGWRVGIWYERTMEKKVDYQVVANKLIADVDADGMNDFEEFLNGSDPTKADTDGDGIADKAEIDLKSNITGIEGTPPQITNIKNYIEVECPGIGWACVPVSAKVKIEFDISDNVGIDKVLVKVIRFGIFAETHTVTLAAGQKSGHVVETFGFSVIEAVGSGADVNISAYDVNGNGAWGQFHIDSLFEAIVKAILAFFAAIAKLIVEAVSAAFNWIWGMIESLINEVFRPISDAIQGWVASIMRIIDRLTTLFNYNEPQGASNEREEAVVDFISGIVDAPVWDILEALVTVLQVVDIVVLVVTLILVGIGGLIVDFVLGIVISMLVASALAALGIDIPALVSGAFKTVGGWLFNLFVLGKSPFSAPDSRTSCELSTGVLDLMAMVIEGLGLILQTMLIEALVGAAAGLKAALWKSAASRPDVADAFGDPASVAPDGWFRNKFHQLGRMGRVLKSLKWDRVIGLMLWAFGLSLFLLGIAAHAQGAPAWIGEIFTLMGLMVETVGFVFYVKDLFDVKEQNDLKDGSRIAKHGKLSGIYRKVEAASVVFGTASSWAGAIALKSQPCQSG